MPNITVEHDPTDERLDDLGVKSWPIWTKEVSTFPWSYASREVCYILEGEVVVTPEDGEAVEIRARDLVTFPEGMSCTWEVRQPIRKHYTFD